MVNSDDLLGAEHLHQSLLQTSSPWLAIPQISGQQFTGSISSSTNLLVKSVEESQIETVDYHVLKAGASSELLHCCISVHGEQGFPFHTLGDLSISYCQSIRIISNL
jgi:hypothetical protein